MPDQSIEELLAAESVRGPRKFRERFLATLTWGLRELRDKVVAPDDTANFHDAVLLFILAEAYSEKPEDEAAKRHALLMQTDDAAFFRTRVNLSMDAWTAGDFKESHRLVNEILGLVEKAEVEIAEKKSVPSASPAPRRTKQPSSPPS